jgi:hypothetical protein
MSRGPGRWLGGLLTGAWILWETISTLEPFVATTSPVKALETHEACEVEKRRRVEGSPRLDGWHRTDNMVLVWKDGRIVTTLMYQCFPDTVDPRGPK